MSKPTGKLAFAYKTIANMEARINSVTNERDLLIELIKPAVRLMKSTAENSGWHENARKIESLISGMQDKNHD